MDTRIEIRPGRVINVTIYKTQQNKATAFLLHGIGGRGRQWREQLSLLKERYTIVIPDLLGHGKSTKPMPQNHEMHNPYLFLQFKEDLLALFDQFATQDNIILGHSYGGALAVSIAMDRINNTKKLVLISPTALNPIMKIPFIYSLPTFLMKLLRPWLEKKFQKLAFAAGTPATLLAEESQGGKINQMEIVKATVQGMQTIPPTDITHLPIPTLIILGKQDGIIPYAISQTFYKALPHAKFEIINTAHMSMLEQPRLVNQLISDFLSRSSTAG